MADGEDTLLNVGGVKEAPAVEAKAEGSDTPWYEKAGFPVDELDDDIKGHKTPEDFLKTHKNQRSMIGKKGDIPKLGPDEDPTAWDEFYSKLGRPKDAKGYEIESKEAGLLEAFLGAGLSKAQAKKLYNQMEGINTKRGEINSQAEAAALDKIKSDLIVKYGGEDEMKAALGKASSFIDESFGENYPEFIEFIRDTKINIGGKETYLANHPVMAEAFRVLSEMVGDDPRGVKGVAPPTKEDMNEEFKRLTLEMGSMPDNYSPEYMDKKKRLDILQKKLFYSE